VKNTKAGDPLHRGKGQKYFPKKMRKRRERRREKEREDEWMRGVSTGFDENLYFQVISVSVRYRGKDPQ
jgi:hypothetical protein